ncbi:hypothetical protein FJW03_14750 [Mesorhizobium sp. B4-1-4]|nr:hypothetical protein [Mesorhizobium sp. B4-1-4]UCI34598.1 hypothetical protein FJW03_14750 [Mesorhizobium sp. B4-1-4]
MPFADPSVLALPQDGLGFRQPGFHAGLSVGHFDADRCLAANDVVLHLERLAAAQDVLDLDRLEIRTQLVQLFVTGL